MESVYLSVKFVQMNPTDLIWSVVGENSGSINGNGCYTAPIIRAFMRCRQFVPMIRM